MVTRLGCPCGCTPDNACVSTKSGPEVSDHCSSCGVLGFGEIRVAQAHGWHCAAGCVAERLGLVHRGEPT